MNRREFILNTGAGGASLLVGADALADVLPMNLKQGLDVKVVKSGGIFKLSLNGKIIDPLSFRTFRPEQRNISEFHAAGVQLMSVLTTGLDCSLDVPYSRFGESWVGPGQYDFSVLDKQMDLFIKNAPNTYFNIKFQLDTRKWWLDLHHEAGLGSYNNLVELAAYEPWRKDAAAYMKALIDHVEQKYGNIVYAYTPFGGFSTEWYMKQANLGLPNTNQLRLEPFRKFIDNDKATIPTLEELSKTSNGVFRNPLKDKNAIDYWRFHHNVIADTIVYFAAEAKKAMKRKKLIGLYFGYLTELANNRLLHEGHLAYEKVWSCPDIDMIYDIASYGPRRTFMGTSGCLSTIDSLNLKKKLCFHECDHTTHIAPIKVENGRNIPGSDGKLKDAKESVNVLRREFSLTRTKGIGLWWFDFFGGYYYDKDIMNSISTMMQAQKKLEGVNMRSVAEIVAFGDTQSMYYVSQNAKINNDCLTRMRDELYRIGAPFDLYDFGFIDDPNIPHDQYKLYIFLNAFKISDKQKQIIEAKVKSKGKTILWLYAPGYLQKEGFSMSEMSNHVRMNLRQLEGQEQQINVTNTAFFSREPAEKSYQSSLPVSPVFYIDDKDVIALGHFAASGKVALGYKNEGSIKSFYSVLGGMPASVIREVARTAGVHIYYEGLNTVHINNRLIAVHFQHNSDVEIKLPFKKSCTLIELYDGGNITAKEGRCILPLDVGIAKLYLLMDGENNIVMR